MSNLRLGNCVLAWAAGVLCLFTQSVYGQTNVLTQHNDIARTGQNTNETILTPANVSSGNFGKLFSLSVDGQVYAQPLYMAGVAIPNAGTHNVVFVATMHDSVYAFDADTQGAPLWQVSLLDAAHGASVGATTDPASDTGCMILQETEIGITSTPVIDPVGGIIYVVGKTYENGYPVQRLHALDIGSGAEKLAPVTLSASVSGTGNGSANGTLTFDPKWENQRAGLLLLNGIVYIGFGGYCENTTSHGWILAYNATTLTQTSAFVTTPNGAGSGIWMSGTGLAADVPSGSPFGRLFVATGNGTYDATTPYTTNQADYGDDVLRLDLTNGVMTVSDAFTPMNQASLQSNSLDLGSGGVVLLPDQTLSGHTHQMLAGGKDGNMYLVDRDSLGGYSTTANNIIEPVVPAQVGGIFGTSAYWNEHVYVWGINDTLKQFNFTNGLMNFWHSANSNETLGFPGSIPSVSANGAANGIVWNIDASAYVNNGNANLLAHDASNVATTLYTSATNATRDNPGQAVKFAVPSISNGKVYVASFGQLSVYGLLAQPDFSLSASPASLTMAQSGTSSGTILITPVNGFSGTVALSATGLPAGLTASFSGASLTSKTLTLSATSATATGTYTVVITGSSGSLSHTLQLTVNVTLANAPAPSFTIAAGPQTVSIVQGQAGTTSVGFTPLNGFSGALTLNATGLPSGVTASFGAASGNVYPLTLTSATTTPAGVYPISIQAAGGSVNAAATLTLVVNNIGQTNVLTQHNDIARTGQNLNETTLTAANVSGGNFGKLFSLSVDGQVYAQPLYFANLAMPNAGTHNVVFVATMHDSVYAFDADNGGTPLWQVTLLDAAHGASAGATTDPVSDTGCGELGGSEIGIISTPVIDPGTGTIYVVGRTYENGYPVQRLHALDIKTGAEKVAPVTLSASIAGTGTGSSNGFVTFDPKWENQRPGLLLVNGIVYIGFGSFCESGPVHGWVLAYNASTLTQTSAFITSPNASGSGIWMSGTGLAADIPAGNPFGRMFLATGNGVYDATTPYGTNTADYGDDVLKLDLTNGVMTVTDAFTPMDQANLNTNGLDLGSGGLMLLPDQPLAGHTHQMLSGGKTGNLYLIDRDSLGGYSTSANNIIEPIIPNQVGGVYSAPAYWNNTVYYWGIEDTLKQFNIDGGLMNFWHSANSNESQKFPGSTPSISANGVSGGIVWNVDTSAYTSNGNAVLYAHDATNVATTLYSSATNATRDNPGPAVKFAVPTISNGKVYVGAYGQVSVYGLLSAPDFSLAATQSSINVMQGASAADSITVGAINGFSGVLTLSASGLPTGMTAAFTPASASSQTLTLTAANSTATGTYTIVITGTAGADVHTLTLSVTVSAATALAPSFTVAAAPQTVSVVQGQTVSANINVAPLNGFGSTVNLSVSGVPAGVTATLGSASGNITALTLTASSSAAAGVYQVTIQGAGGGSTNSGVLTLVVNNVGQVNVLTQHNDIGRTGQNTNETILTPANVSGGGFGKLFSMNVDGQVYAQPLYFANLNIAAGTHNVVFIATMHDSVYAFDADNGTQLWQITLLDAAHGASAGATTDPQTDTGCNELAGTELGITGTPVIDPGSGTIYVVGKTLENGYPLMRLHALDITTGADKVAPVTLSATVAGNGTGSSNGILTFDPKWENQRPGLLLINGIVYIAFASYCDNGPYHGWVLAYNGSTLAQTSVFTPTPNGSASGIWMSGAGLAADIPAGNPFGRMFVVTGNGTYDAVTPYTTNQADYGDDVIRLDLTNGVMTVTDEFTPMDQAAMAANDQDLSSGGAVVLPDQPLTGHPHQLLAAGKTGVIYVIDRDNMGGYSTTANNIIQTITPHQVGGIFSVPAYWNGHAYYWGISDYLDQFNFTNGLINLYHSESSTEKQGFPGSTPSISSNGTANAIVWNIDSSAWTSNGNANLLAHDATNVSTTLYTSATNPTRDNPGGAVKFAAPTVSNGKVYVAGYGVVSVFGLFATTPDFTLTAAQNGLNVVVGNSVANTIYINQLNGFSGTVNLSASGLPAGMSASLQPGSTAGTSTLTLSAASGTPAGTYQVVITGVSGSLTHTVSVGVTVALTAVPSFSLTASASSASLAPGNSATINVTVVPANGFNSSVTLSTAALPPGVTATFGPLTNNVSTLTLTASSTADPATATVLINGVSGTLTANTSIRTTVTSTSPGFTLTASPAAVSVMQGQSGTSNITVVPVNGFNSAVTLAASGLPTGVTASFGSTTNGVSIMTLTAASNAPPGSALVTITGTSGSLTAIAAVTLTVTAQPTSSFTLGVSPSTYSLAAGSNGSASVSVTPTNGFTGTVTFSVAGLPSGVTATFAPASSTTGSTLSFTSGVSTTAGTYMLTITGASGSLTVSTGLTLTITASQSFTLSASPAALALVPGQTTSSSITVVPANGFNSAVSLAATGLPSGVTATFGSAVNGVSTMTLSAANNAAAGSATVTVTGASGALTASTSLSLNVTAAPAFTLTAAPSSLSVVEGQSGTSSISISSANGFNSAVSFAASGLPSGVTASFGAVANGAATLTLSASSTATLGTTTVTITGTSGSVTASTSVSLTVTAPPSFTLSASPGSVSVVQGQSGTTSVMITPANGFNSAVNLSASGVPSGITASFGAVTNGTATLTLSVSSTAAVGTTTVTITGTSGSVTAKTSLSLTVSALPTFALTAAPAAISVVAGQSGNSTISVVPTNGFASAVTLSASGLPAGATATFAAGSGTSQVMTLASSSTTPAGTYTVTVQGVGGGVASSITVSYSVAASGSPVSVSLTPVANVYGIFNNGVAPTNGGFDSEGYAYSSSLVSNSLAALSVPFTLGPAGTADATNSSTIALPSGTFSSLKFLAAGVNGNQANQSFVVTYTDGTTSSFTQSVSDWGSPQSYTGETQALSTAYRVTPTGTTQTGPFYIYAYSLSLNSAKVVKSFTLPNNRNLVVLGVTLSPAVPGFSLGVSANALSIAPGKTSSTVVSVTPSNGFTGAVTFSATGLPSGVTAAFNPASSTSGSTFTLTAASTAVAGTYTATINGVSGSLTASTKVTLTIAPPDFSIALSSTSITLTRAGLAYPAATDTATISALSGFTGTVTMSISGTPANLTTAFSPTSVITSGTSKLTLTPGLFFGAGTYTLTIKATSGSLSHTTTLTLIAK